MKRLSRLSELNAFSITIIYLVFALIWILLSDQFLIWITNDPQQISRYQTFKGIFYVLLTGAYLYILINKSNQKTISQKNRIDTALYAAGMATWSVDLKSRKIRRSKFHYKIFGLKKNPRKWTVKEFYDSVHPEDHQKVQNELERTIQQDLPFYHVKFRVITSEDEIRWVESRGNLTFDQNNNPEQIAGVISDITEQKKLEDDYHREKELFQSIFEKIPVMVDIYDAEINEIRVNNAFENYLGWSNEEIRKIDLMSVCYPDPEKRAKAEKVMSEANGEWHEFEVTSKSGEKRIQRWSNIRLSDGNIIGIGLDITEKKLLEEEHEKDRLELQKVYDNIPVLINLHDDKNNVYRVNSYFEEKVGFTNQEMDSINLIEEMIPGKENQEAAIKHMDAANGSWKDFRITTKSGDTIYTTWTNIKVTDSLSLGIGIDTTELKQKERELEELTSRYKSAEKLAKLGNWKRNLKTNETVISDGFYDIVEVDRDKEKLDFEKLQNIIHPEDWDSFTKAIEGAMQSGSIDTNYRIIKQKSDEIAHVHELGRINFNEQGEPIKLTGTIQDITESKRSQAQLKESQALFQKTFESLNECVIILEPKTRVITNCNKTTCDLFGYSKDELIGSTTEKLHIKKSSSEEFGDTSIKELEKNGVFQTEYKMKKKDGTEFHSDHTVTLVKNEQGEVEKVVSVVRDITERKAQEQELKQRNDFIESTLENLPIGVAVNLMDSGEATLMNKKFSEIYGWPQKILKNVETFFESVYPDEAYRQRITEVVMADINSEDPKRMNWEGVKITTQSGKEKIVNAKNIPLYDQNLMISTVVDVTAQVEAERRLAESEHNYRLLFQKSPEPMLIYDPESLTIIEVNNAAVSHYGYSRKEFYSMTLLDIRPKEDWDEVKKIISKDKEQKFTPPMGARHLKKNGEIIYVKVTASSINYFGNNYRLVLINDITEQKEAEEMVLASLVEGENKERARIAQELHDGLGQYLAAANMNLDAVSNEIDTLSDRKKGQFQKGLNLLKHAVTETAQISRNLLPRVVDDYGLALAIESLVDNYQSGSEIDIIYYQNIKDLELPREVQFNLYRIAQEGISNAVKYSEASEINVQLLKDELDLILTIDDNGVGFDISSETFTPGLGLQTIKTRAGALGGTFEFDSKPNKGTFLNVVVPIHKNSNAS